jgi:hypothetical protein
LTVSTDGRWVYGLYPEIERKVEGEFMRVQSTDLLLYRWAVARGAPNPVVSMIDLVSVPLATAGRGDRGYVLFSTDGENIFIAWQDMLWSLDVDSLMIVNELRLQASVDGMVQSIDGHELYLLPSTSGDLLVKELGMFTVDTANWEFSRHADDWPRLINPFLLVAQAQGSASD